ncbi:MAG: hypothetical protein FIB07_02265 [Candidatus Methanoperedens sp.]|nr:hypothetical protein [Candidatus Methanoperedens sp.]
MKSVNYTAKILSDGHLSIPQEIRQELDLSVNTLVKVTLKIDTRREKAIKAFGAWSDRTDIKNGIEYTEKIRSEWDERKED